MTDPITVLVADDHPMFRTAVVHTLAGAIDARVLEVASQSVLKSTLAADPDTDLLLLDLTHARREWPLLAAVAAFRTPLSSGDRDFPNDRPRTVRRAQQVGAAGFISKAAPMEAMGTAIT